MLFLISVGPFSKPVLEVARDMTELASTPEEKPWLGPDLLPPKPPGSPYGYQSKDQLHPCSQEELVAACGPGASVGVDLVWHPDAERLVPVIEVPFLREPWLRRQRKATNQQLILGVLGLATFGLACIRAEPGWRDLLWVNLLFLGLLPIYECAYGLWQLRSNVADKYLAAIEGARFGLWLGRHRIAYTWVILAVSASVSIVGFVCGLEDAIQTHLRQFEMLRP